MELDRGFVSCEEILVSLQAMDVVFALGVQCRHELARCLPPPSIRRHARLRAEAAAALLHVLTSGCKHHTARLAWPWCWKRGPRRLTRRPGGNAISRGPARSARSRDLRA